MTPNPDAPSIDEHIAASAGSGREHASHRREAGGGEAGDVVAIRRNILLSGVVGVLAGLIGLAFLARSGGFLDRPLGVFLIGVAALHLVSLGSWRLPVLVADEQGIRLRLGLAWRGLPWSSIRQIVVEHPESPLRDGRFVVVPRDLATTSDDLDRLAQLHLRWNRLWYGAPLSIPLGMTTFVDTPDLAGDLRALSDGRVDIADLRGRQLANLAEVPVRARAVEPPAHADDAVALVDEVDEIDEIAESDEVTDVERQLPVDELPPPPEDDVDEVVLPAPVSPLREIRRPVRAEVRLERPDPVEPAEPDHVPDSEDTASIEVPVQRRPSEISALLAGTFPVPAEEPARVLIGPKIAHAREMLDMSVEELSNRTRIRPHVLEAMEVDDFDPCGGDVYARGHLTAVARTLGLAIEPLMAAYDDHYAQAPINARRVFEAELSTGQSSGMRATFGGPRWSLLISAVLCLTMVWGLARIFAGNAEQLSAAPGADVAVQSANRTPITSPLMRTSPMTVTAAHAPAHIVVRDRTGRILWSGDLAQGGHRKVIGLPPFKVSADNAGAVEVTVDKKSLGTIGTAGQSGAKNFG